MTSNELETKVETGTIAYISDISLFHHAKHDH